MEIKNFGDLKNYLNSLDEKFLSEPVYAIVGDSESDCHNINSIDELEEDYYLTDEGFIPESEFDDEQLEEQPLSERDKKEKGTPRLWSTF